MALVELQAIPKRTTQGTKLSSYQHDVIHEQDRQAINAVIAYLNGGGGFLGSLPVGQILPWYMPTAPSGPFMFVEDIVYNKNVYTQLFVVYGTRYNQMGDGPNDFRLPPMGERYLKGVSDVNDVGDLGGAATQNITPAGTVAVDVTNGAMSGTLDVTNGALLGNITNNLASNVSVGLGSLASNVSVDIGTLVSNVSAVNNSLTGDIIIENGPLTGSGTVAIVGVSCVPIPDGEAGPNQAIDCGAGLEVEMASIAASLETNVTGNKGDLASDVDVINNPLTGTLDVTNGAMTGTLDVTNGPLTGTITSNLTSDVSVALGTLTSDVSATALFTGTEFTVTLDPVHIKTAWIVKYQ